MAVYQDKERKTWYCKFYYTDYTGEKKQKKKSGFARKKDAQEWERDFLEKVQGTPDMTFQTLYEIYIEDMSHRLRENSVEGKKNVFKNRILPYFKEKSINEITPADIRAWQNEQIEKGYSLAYLDRIQNMLTTIMNYAVKYYNLPSNPCDKAGHMGKRTRSQNFWTAEEFNQIISTISDPVANIAMKVLFYSGMRFGELVALTLNDLDFKENTITINKSLQHRAKLGDIITPPKTDNGIRCISMPETIMHDLKDYTERIYKISANDRVFTFTKSLINGNINRSAASTGIKRIRIHDLRHSHVSLLIEMGFSAHLIAERIGDTVQMVNNTYGHLYPTKHKEVANKLNELLIK